MAIWFCSTATITRPPINALMISGIPVYVPTARNAHGLIGPMDFGSLNEETLRERIRTIRWSRTRCLAEAAPVSLRAVEQRTYDGTIHNAEMILKAIGHLCDYILFDEAWAAS